MEPKQKKENPLLNDGIYFGMGEETYHAIPRLSASGIKSLIVSGPDFWGRSWFNPHKAEDETESETLDLGKAYHKRILEGLDAFNKCYAPEFENDDPGVIRTTDHIKDRLKEMELPVSFKNKAEGTARLIEAGVPEDEFFEVLQSKYLAKHEGKEFLNKKTMRRIAFAAACIEEDARLKALLSGGFPEVTILWTDEETGVPMKARLDYWKPDAIPDLKTFSNQYGKPLNRAVAGNVANYKYHIQVAVYHEAVAQAVKLAKGKNPKAFYQTSPGQYLKIVSRAQIDFLKEISPEPDFWFIFQQTGIAPLTIARRFPRELLLLDKARADMRRGMELFVQFYNNREAKYWAVPDHERVADFNDQDFPLWLLEQD